MSLARHKTFFDLAAKFASLDILFGGPLLVSDTLRSWIGKGPAVVLVGVVPLVCFYMGASHLAESDDFRPRRAFLRLGVLGALLIAPMNAYAIDRLMHVGPSLGMTTVWSVGLCSVVIIAYLVLATRELRMPPPAKPPLDP